MTLFSAYEDLVGRTLGAIGSTLEQLSFLAGLRNEKGQYEHWGLEYTHGPKIAREAMKRAHAEVFQKLLETPLPELEREFKKKAAPANLDQMVPVERNGCSPEHFRYVTSALTLLAEAPSNLQVA